jgi:glycosyltransferase involved in cell wall biosynthesis
LIELVVVLRGKASAADRGRTIESLTRNTSELEVRMVVLDAAESVWDVVESAENADVVLLDVGTVVGPGWWSQLRAAAYEDTIVATASAVPADLLALDRSTSEGLSRAVTTAVRDAALGEPLWGCVYVRRDALKAAMVGDRKAQRPSRLEDAIVVPGLVHVLAGTVVLPPAQSAAPRRLGSTPAVRRMLAEVEARVDQIRVTVDLRCCSLPIAGTQVHALNLVSSLAATDAVRLSVLLPAVVDPSLRQQVEKLPQTVRRYRPGSPILPPPHVFHRPYQLVETELADVASSGVRLVITHQDMILDRTPGYFDSFDHWLKQPAATALAFFSADEVVFYSEHARREAVREGLVDEAKTSVVPPGTNHLEGGLDEETMPPGFGPLVESEARPFVLVIGTAFKHKNRLFALRVVDELRRVHDWNGLVVFAGVNPLFGSSGREEAAFLRGHRDLAERVVDLGPVNDAGRSWLYRHAAVVLFPTLYEGFGLVPFEAAAGGTASAYASRSSVAEYLPAEGALLELGDVTETARRLHVLLESREARDEIVRNIRLAGSRLTWDRAADSYIEIYRRAMTRPIGLSLVLGSSEVIVGLRSQIVTSETERRVLLVLRRSAAVRLATEGVVAILRRARPIVRRLTRARA